MGQKKQKNNLPSATMTLSKSAFAEFLDMWHSAKNFKN
jgi:hypothetical protein